MQTQQAQDALVSPVHHTKFETLNHKLFVLCSTSAAQQQYKVIDLVHACESTHLPALLNRTNFMGYTPLMLAISNSKFEIVSALLSTKLPISVEITSHADGMNALLLACKYACHHIAMQLVQDFKANVNACDATQKTALMYACQSKCTPIVALLLQNKANINARDANGKSAFFYASTPVKSESILVLFAKAGVMNDY